MTILTQKQIDIPTLGTIRQFEKNIREVEFIATKLKEKFPQMPDYHLWQIAGNIYLGSKIEEVSDVLHDS